MGRPRPGMPWHTETHSRSYKHKMDLVKKRQARGEPFLEGQDPEDRVFGGPGKIIVSVGLILPGETERIPYGSVPMDNKDVVSKMIEMERIQDEEDQTEE